MAGYLENPDLFHGDSLSPPPQWDAAIGDLGGYLFKDRASGSGSVEEFMSLQTLTGSQTFVLSATFDGGVTITFKIEEISYPGGPSVGGLFEIISTVHTEQISTLQDGVVTVTLDPITVELPSEMHIRVSAKSGISSTMVQPNELTLTLQGGSSLFWTNRTNVTERPL